MAEAIRRELKRIGITLSKTALGIICIVFGVLFIVFPFLLAWIVGLFLLVDGIIVLTEVERKAAEPQPKETETKES